MSYGRCCNIKTMSFDRLKPTSQRCVTFRDEVVRDWNRRATESSRHSDSSAPNGSDSARSVRTQHPQQTLLRDSQKATIVLSPPNPLSVHRSQNTPHNTLTNIAGGGRYHYLPGSPTDRRYSTGSESSATSIQSVIENPTLAKTRPPVVLQQPPSSKLTHKAPSTSASEHQGSPGHLYKPDKSRGQGLRLSLSGRVDNKVAYGLVSDFECTTSGPSSSPEHQDITNRENAAPSVVIGPGKVVYHKVNTTDQIIASQDNKNKTSNSAHTKPKDYKIYKGFLQRFKRQPTTMDASSSTASTTSSSSSRPRFLGAFSAPYWRRGSSTTDNNPSTTTPSVKKKHKSSAWLPITARYPSSGSFKGWVLDPADGGSMSSVSTVSTGRTTLSPTSTIPSASSMAPSSLSSMGSGSTTTQGTAGSAQNQQQMTPGRRARQAVPRWLLALPLLTLLVTVSGGKKSQAEVSPPTGSGSGGTSSVVGPLGAPRGGFMQLTPWWNVSMAIGETLVIDCGVFVGTGTGSTETGSGSIEVPTPEIRWTDASGNVLTPQSNTRVELRLREKNHPADLHLGAYRVLTLTLHHLVAADTGTYRCDVNRSSQQGLPDGAPTADSRNFTLTVLSADTVCTMEGEDMCGWKDLADDKEVMIRWRRLDGKHDISLNRSSGRYDHTYGASKHVGHFLDVDRFREAAPQDALARLQSPQRAPHSKPGCFHFWYIYYGNDHEYLRVKLTQVNNSVSDNEESDDQDETIVYNMTNANTPNVWISDWVLATVELPPKTNPYHVTFEVKTCLGRCKKSRLIALDDFRFFSDDCDTVQKNSATIWPNRNLPVRLVNGSTPYDGRVEVLHDAMWGSVCSTQFGAKEAKVICSYLGFKGEGAQGRRRSEDGGADSHVIIWLQRLGCNGTERDLGACIAKGETWGSTDDCSHLEDARVLCGEVAPSPMPTLPVSMIADKTSTTATTMPSRSSITPSRSSITSSRSSITSSSPSGAVPSILPAGHTPSTTTLPPPPVFTTEQTYEETTVPPEPLITDGSVNTPRPGKISSTTATPSSTTLPLPATSASKTVTSSENVHTAEPRHDSNKGDTTNGAGRGGEVKVLSTLIPEHYNISNNTDTWDGDTDAMSDDDGPSRRARRGAGAAVGISLTILLIAAVAGIWVYRKRKNRRKSKYIVFSNPKYSREHLPANDISMDSPLTSGSSILA